MSIILDNLMKTKGYTPYCGNSNCFDMPRTVFKKGQFHCPSCKWKSQIAKQFINNYKKKWSIK